MIPLAHGVEPTKGMMKSDTLYRDPEGNAVSIRAPPPRVLCETYTRAGCEVISVHRISESMVAESSVTALVMDPSIGDYRTLQLPVQMSKNHMGMARADAQPSEDSATLNTVMFIDIRHDVAASELRKALGLRASAQLDFGHVPASGKQYYIFCNEDEHPPGATKPACSSTPSA